MNGAQINTRSLCKISVTQKKPGLDLTLPESCINYIVEGLQKWRNSS